MDRTKPVEEEYTIRVAGDEVSLEGNLGIPQNARGMVLFAHGSGSSRHSPRNRYVARRLRQAGLATLLIDLLTAVEETEDLESGRLRFDIPLLSRRVVGATDWLKRNRESQNLNIGYFGASTGAAAALLAAVQRPETVSAIVSRGGRPDLAEPVLAQVRAPTLLIVGGLDFGVINLNREAFRKLNTEKELVIVPGATHLFEEPGALEEVARLAADWFGKYLAAK